MRPPDHRAAVLAAAAATDLVGSYLLAVLVVGLAGLSVSAGVNPPALLAAAVPLWLAAHQVPLMIAGAPLGALPLLPTLLLVCVTAAVAARATRRLGGRWRDDGVPVVASLAVAHATVAVLVSALPPTIAQASTGDALLGGGAVAACGATWGTLRAAAPPGWWTGAPGWLRVGAHAARAALAGLFGVGALLLLVALIVHLPAVHDRVESVPGGIGPKLGVALVSLGYLPNAVVAALGWAAGPGLSIGQATSSPLAAAPGPLPPLPLMSAFPTGHLPGWAMVVGALPMIVGGMVGLVCRAVGPDQRRRLGAVAVATGSVAVVVGAAAAIVSGHLASGPFDPLVVPAGPLALALAGWVGVPGAVLACGAPPRAWHRAGRSSAGRSMRDPVPVRPRPGRRFDGELPYERGDQDGTVSASDSPSG